MFFLLCGRPVCCPLLPGTLWSGGMHLWPVQSSGGLVMAASAGGSRFCLSFLCFLQRSMSISPQRALLRLPHFYCFGVEESTVCTDGFSTSQCFCWDVFPTAST